MSTVQSPHLPHNYELFCELLSERKHAFERIEAMFLLKQPVPADVDALYQNARRALQAAWEGASAKQVNRIRRGKKPVQRVVFSLYGKSGA